MSEQAGLQPELSPGILVAQSPSMRDLVNLLKRVAPTDLGVLILGEPGVGKQSVAREIHRQSRRTGGPFVHVPCGAIPEAQLDVELFGQQSPFAEGDRRRRAGLIEHASQGTLFLDEVWRLPFWASVKLLDVIQRQPHLAYGGLENGPLGVRLIAAASRDLDAAVSQNDFYSGLYYMLSAVQLRVPPLRDRREDIPALAAHFLAAADGASRRRHRFSSDAIDRLMAHDWAGNARELASVVVHAMLSCDSEEIAPECVADAIGSVRRRGNYQEAADTSASSRKSDEKASSAKSDRNVSPTEADEDARPCPSGRRAKP